MGCVKIRKNTEKRHGRKGRKEACAAWQGQLQVFHRQHAGAVKEVVDPDQNHVHEPPVAANENLKKEREMVKKNNERKQTR